MSKELVISATPHETRVAILEDGHLCEIYIEREKEFALVGSIYKGRVTRVLPGMQSAFVDIGRDTDAFLYVSDFLENLEDYDHVTADEAKAHAPAASSVTTPPPALAPPATTIDAPAPVEHIGGSGIGILEGETIGRGSGEPTSAPYSQTIGVAPDFDPTAENLAHGSAAIEPSDSAPPQDYVAPSAQVAQSQGNYPPTPARTHSSGQGQHDRPRNDRGFGGGGGRGGRDRGGDRGGNRGGRFRRGGGRDRGGRPQGRDLPASKYASSSGPSRAPYSPHSPAGSFAPRDSHDESSSSAENLPPIILPGESLAKYKERPAAAQTSSPSVLDSGSAPTTAMGYEHPEGFGDQVVPTQHSDSELPPVAYTKMESVAPPTLDLHIEPAHDASFPMGREAAEETALEAAAHEEIHEERAEVKDSHDRYANIEVEFNVGKERISSEEPLTEHSSVSASDDAHSGMGFTHSSPADITDEQARTLAESLVEAKHEEAQDEVDDEAALAIGGADFSDAEADAAHDEAHDEAESDDAEVNGNVHDENHEDSGHETHDEAADAAHDEAHNANIDAGDPEAVHAAGEFAEPGSAEPTSSEQQHADTKFNREPRSARVEDPRRNARFQRPQRRSGGGQRGGRPMRHGSRPPERHGRPSSGGGHAPQRRPQLISEMLKAGQEIIVQIAKEPLGKKGARITSHVALPGRFLVYMPTVNHIGVSRKISSAETRSRLRSIVGEYKSTFPGGFIVRTAAGNVSDADLRMDIEFLGKTWHEICARSENKKAPALIHRDLNLVERILRDYVSSDYTSIWIDNEEEFSKVVEFVSRFQPDLVSRVKLYTKEAPIFEEFGIQQELDKAMRPKVWLKSGGYIVINHTEALVAIDVNTGKFVGRGSTRLEDTIVKTNLEAVKEIVRQIRLRDLGGIIIVDFIDMEERRNRDKVMHAIDDELRADKAPSKVLSFNEFGLVAITRKRTKQALEKVLCQPCPYCTGSGMVKSIPTICFEIQMEARKMAGDLDAASVTLRVHPEIAKALKTRESALVEELESISKKSVIIQSDPTLHWEQYDIY